MKVLSFHHIKNSLSIDFQQIKSVTEICEIKITKQEPICYQQLTDIEKDNLLNFKTITITSKNAANWLIENAINWEGTIYTNSQKTSHLLSKMPNIKIHISEQAYAKELGLKLCKDGIKSFLNITGTLGLNHLKEIAEQNDIKYARINVYTTIYTPKVFQLSDYNVVIFTSPSQVFSFFKLNTWKKFIFALCIGKTTASALTRFNVDKQLIYYPEQASLENMLRLLPKIKRNFEQQKTK